MKERRVSCLRHGNDSCWWLQLG